MFGIRKGSRELAPEVAMLMGVPMFSALTRRELEVLSGILHERDYLGGEIIFDEGEEGLGMYIIVTGRVKVSRKLGQESRELAVMGPGETFGELALLDGAPRAATATAVDDARVLGFFRPEFLDIMETHHRIGMKISFALAVETAKRLRASLNRERALASL
ncbi:MAG: cyclic nucleotide-binding domain-containing protein [Verrucomicrobiia bacterium]